MRMRRLLVLVGATLIGCESGSSAPISTNPDGGAGQADRDAGGRSDADAGTDAATDGGSADVGPICVLGTACNPIPIGSNFPFVDRRDTRDSDSRAIDAYACAPQTDESGPELFYVVQLTRPGVLTASLNDVPGDDVDVDVHLLDGRTGDACLERDNVGLARQLEPGTYFLTADSWVNGAGDVLAGPYTLTVDFTETATGACATVQTDVRMFWSACDPGVPDCFEQGGERFLKTPTVGPVVKEAHLVTEDEDFGGGWPSAARDRIDRHYQVSEAASGWTFTRTEPWAPAGEGGSEWGQGATGAPVPVLDEAWYITMFWRDRPARGTRMIVRNPANGRVVVASAGYETGPGANTAIAGVVEEVHLYLDTTHRDDLEIGFAADQSLPLGPIQCD